MIDRILHILSLPKTLVVGQLSKAFNPYTLFLPYREDTEYDYVLVTQLTAFEKRRIELCVPYTPAEHFIAGQLMNRKPVFALQSVELKNAVAIPDCNTKLVTAKTVTGYPFQKMYVPKGCIVTDMAKEQNIEFEEFDLCESEKFAEVFGQPKRVTG